MKSLFTRAAAPQPSCRDYGTCTCVMDPATIGKHVFIELSSVCNLLCEFCAYTWSERKGTMMPLELLELAHNVGPGGAFRAGFDGQFLGGEKLFAMNFAVNDPAIHKTFLASVGDRNGFQVMVVLEIGIDVGVPIELLHDEV